MFRSETHKNGVSIWGKLVTAHTSSNDWGTVLKAIDQSDAGKILFLKSDNDNKAIWGELTSKAAQNKKIKGTIIFGAVRVFLQLNPWIILFFPVP